MLPILAFGAGKLEMTPGELSLCVSALTNVQLWKRVFTLFHTCVSVCCVCVSITDTQARALCYNVLGQGENTGLSSKTQGESAVRATFKAFSFFQSCSLDLLYFLFAIHQTLRKSKSFNY